MEYYADIAMVAVIQNADALGATPLRRDALAIVEAAYEAADIRKAFARKVRIEDEVLVVEDVRWPLRGRRIFFVGVGKCAIAAAEAVERLLGDRLVSGIALDVRGLAGNRLEKTETFVGTHPRPSETNLVAAARIVELLELAGEDALVLMLISGGGSTLLCLHDAPMTCLDEGMLFDALTDRGAAIQELNIVRKHLSKARGGWLAKAAYPAEVLAFVVSDVPGNDLEFIASGPTVLDHSTVADAQAVLARYGVPEPLGGFIETPKEASYFARVTNTLFLTNHDALDAMQREAERLGYRAIRVDDAMHGEARELAAAALERLHAAAPKTALLCGGESTVTLSGSHGKGGRNQELALAALGSIRKGELLIPFASDGRDATEHAGAIADELTLAHARERRVDIDPALALHASHDFFETTGDALVTGLLESNVSDLLLALKT